MRVADEGIEESRYHQGVFQVVYFLQRIPSPRPVPDIVFVPCDIDRCLTPRGGENGLEVLPARDMHHTAVFDLVEGLEGREYILGDIAADGYGGAIVEVLDRVREEGRGGVAGLTVADLLERARAEMSEHTETSTDSSEDIDEAGGDLPEVEGGLAEVKDDRPGNRVRKKRPQQRAQQG